MEKAYAIIQVQPDSGEYSAPWDAGHRLANTWAEQIKAGSRLRFWYVENGEYLGQCDLVKEYGSHSKGIKPIIPSRAAGYAFPTLL